jgi:hypothetical protein
MFKIKMDIQITGLEKFKDLSSTLFEYALPRDLDYAFNIGYSDSQASVPVRTGYLKSTGQVSAPAPLERELSYSADYAGWTDLHHPTQAGWFTRSSEYIQQTLPQLVDRTVKEQVGIVSRK